MSQNQDYGSKLIQIKHCSELTVEKIEEICGLKFQEIVKSDHRTVVEIMIYAVKTLKEAALLCVEDLDTILTKGHDLETLDALFSHPNLFQNPDSPIITNFEKIVMLLGKNISSEEISQFQLALKTMVVYFKNISENLPAVLI